MTTEQKRDLIANILSTLKEQAFLLNKHFDYANTFFGLIFMSDKELKKIAALSGVK